MNKKYVHIVGAKIIMVQDSSTGKVLYTISLKGKTSKERHAEWKTFMLTLRDKNS